MIISITGDIGIDFFTIIPPQNGIYVGIDTCGKMSNKKLAFYHIFL